MTSPASESEHGDDLKCGGARVISYVGVAVPQRHAATLGGGIVALAIAEGSLVLVTEVTIEFDADIEHLIHDILIDRPATNQAMALPSPFWQSVGALNVEMEPPLQKAVVPD